MRRAQRPPEEVVRESLGRAASFGDLLKEHRRITGFSQEHLAERAQLSATAVGALERGEHRAPRRDTVILLADALGLGDVDRALLEAAASRARGRAGRNDEPERPSALREVHNNLPAPTTDFVGRVNEIATVRELLIRGEQRLVTIVGPGGVGKSRLALEISRAIARSFADGAWFVALAEVSDPSSIPIAIANALGIAERGQISVKAALQQALRARDLAIVLDNCEHLLSGVADIASALVTTCAGVRILATSRERLRIAGEATFTLSTLQYPLEPTRSAEVARSYAAVELFERRATLLGADFCLTDDNARLVGDIVRCLDGLPLAIELVVPRLRVLDLPEIAERLADRFGFLVRGARDSLPRHQTLRALIEWSYESLTAEERAVFERCTLLQGPFSLEAVTAICAPQTADVVLDLFGMLVDKSLVVVDGASGRRYTLLDSIREYGRARLRPADVELVLKKHAEHFLHVAERTLALKSTPRSAERIKALQCDRANYEAVLRWALIEGNDREIGAKLTLALRDLFEHESYTRARGWYEAALAKDDASVSPALFVDLTLNLELFSRYSLDTDSRIPNLERAVALCRMRPDGQRLATALGFLSNALAATGQWARADEVAAEAVCHERRLRDPKRLAWALRVRALAQPPERHAEQLALLEESLQAYNPIDPDYDVADGLALIGEVKFYSGNIDAARTSTLRALAILRRTPELFRPAQAQYLLNVAAFSLTLGDTKNGAAAAREALEIATTVGDTALISFALIYLGLLSALTADWNRSANLAGFCAARLDAIPSVMTRIERSCHDRLTALLFAHFGAQTAGELMQTAQTWTLGQAIDEGFRV